MVWKGGSFTSVLTNPYGGPDPYTLLGYGALFVPCMRANPKVSTYPIYIPNPEYKGHLSANGSASYYNNVYDLCVNNNGIMPAYTTKNQPQQWFRIFSSVLINRGVFDWVFNGMIMWRLGFPFEKIIGPIRMILFLLLTSTAAGMFQVIMDPTTGKANKSQKELER